MAQASPRHAQKLTLGRGNLNPAQRKTILKALKLRRLVVLVVVVGLLGSVLGI